jgi:hypothetical protein
MKKKIIILLISVIGILLTACGGDGQDTYYPSCSQMQENLQNKYYQVNVQTIQNDLYSGTCLTAKKGDEYIEFYWLDSCNTITSIEQDLITKYPNYNKLISMENDSKFGTFIFCSSEKAMNDAGIVIVDVKVKVS